MEDKILKQIESEAAKLYPCVQLTSLSAPHAYSLEELAFIEGAKFGYNIKESINDTITEAVRVMTGYLSKVEEKEDRQIIIKAMYECERLSASQNTVSNEEWISVEHALPKNADTVLVFTSAGGTSTCFITAKQWRYAWNSKYIDSSLTVTHWKEINPPKEK